MFDWRGSVCDWRRGSSVQSIAQVSGSSDDVRSAEQIRQRGDSGEPAPGISGIEKQVSRSRQAFCGALWQLQQNESFRDDYPLQPAVLMLVSPPGGSDVTDCLATHITDAIRRAHNSSKAFKLNLHDFALSGKRSDALKLELDDMLSDSFTSGDKVGVLYNIQDLPARTAMLFHSYCDNENAPFKDHNLDLHR